MEDSDIDNSIKNNVERTEKTQNQLDNIFELDESLSSRSSDNDLSSFQIMNPLLMMVKMSWLILI